MNKRPPWQSQPHRRGFQGELKASGRSLTSKLLGAVAGILLVGVGLELGLPLWAGLPLFVVGALFGYFAVYNRGWRKWLRDHKYGSQSNVIQFGKPKRQFPLRPALAGIAALTTAGVGGVYLYHRSSNTEVANQPLQLSGPNIFTCEVASITDGDTLSCADGTRVRLNAVAARETDGTCTVGHPCPNAPAEAATAELNELARGQTLQCRQTGTSYGRKAAICVNEDGIELNCAMVQSGTALIWPEYAVENPICVY